MTVGRDTRNQLHLTQISDYNLQTTHNNLQLGLKRVCAFRVVVLAWDVYSSP